MRNTNFMIACMLITLGILSYARLTQGDPFQSEQLRVVVAATSSEKTTNATPLPKGTGTINTTSTTYSTSSHCDAVKGAKTTKSNKTKDIDSTTKSKTGFGINSTSGTHQTSCTVTNSSAK